MHDWDEMIKFDKSFTSFINCSISSSDKKSVREGYRWIGSILGRKQIVLDGNGKAGQTS